MTTPDLYGRCLARAKDAAGGERAFWVIGATLRQALVANEILALLDLQDPDGVTDATVRALLADLRQRLMDDETLAV